MSGEDRTYRIVFEPFGRRVYCEDGATVLEAAWRAGVPIASICGGEGACGRCKVSILSGAVSPPNDTEKQWLTDEELASGLRLACQVIIHSDLKINVPPESLVAQQRLQIAGIEPEVALEPVITDYDISLPPPSLTDLRSDLTRLTDRLAEVYGLRGLDIDIEAGRRLPSLLREGEWKATVSIRDGEIIALKPPGEACLGVAIDLGTTKIAAYLVDLDTGETLATNGVMNPQIAYGEDVMSRIAYAMRGGGSELSRVVVTALNGLIERLCDQCAVRPETIMEVTIVGNTAMHHLLLHLPVDQLGTAPYVPAVAQSLDVKARELGLRTAPGAYVHILPNIAGFVGADHVAMILATRLHLTDETILALDIGTNTEVVLARGGALISCSTASGPAFEGAHIKDGMRAASGAIERVRINDSMVQIWTIDDAPPVGICGSGILDAIAELHRVGAIDRTGRLQEGHPLVRRSKDGLVIPLTSEGQKEIVITQKDVREIQLAKGAIWTGIDILLQEKGINYEELDRVVIAGAFGMYINPESAIHIGMLPPLPLERFEQVGNAAGVGAKLALISHSQRAMAEEIARRARYLELTTHPDFASKFAQAMYLS